MFQLRRNVQDLFFSFDNTLYEIYIASSRKAQYNDFGLHIVIEAVVNIDQMSHFCFVRRKYG